MCISYHEYSTRGDADAHSTGAGRAPPDGVNMMEPGALNRQYAAVVQSFHLQEMTLRPFAPRDQW